MVRLVSKSQRAAPPRQVEFAPPRQAEFVICDYTIETFNEDAKEHLGFEDYQLHKLRGIRRHWYLSFAAYSLLGDQGHPGRSRHGVRAPLESTGQRCQAVADEVLGHLVDWIAQRLEEGLSAPTIVQTLLA